MIELCSPKGKELGKWETKGTCRAPPLLSLPVQQFGPLDSDETRLEPCFLRASVKGKEARSYDFARGKILSDGVDPRD